jgi:hypothetical protein
MIARLLFAAILVVLLVAALLLWRRDTDWRIKPPPYRYPR